MSGHTPTPWIAVCRAGEWAIRTDDGWQRPIASCWLNGDDPEATAALIVEAVNTHAALVAERDALRKAAEAVDALWTLDAINYADEMNMDSPVGKVWTLVRAALSQHQREEGK